MKPYNERLPMIDEAVEYHNGVWPQDKAPYGEECLVLLDNGHYIITMGIPGKDGYLCNRVQFEKRAKELGWINGQKEQVMNNDWYENGELPPANTECEVKIEGQWLPTVVIGHYANEAVVVDPCVTVQRFFCTTANNLRPLRTETNKLVEQAMSLFSETESTTDAQEGIEHAVRKLIEQGYRKIKPMSEQEFMERCVDICEHGDSRLYRAGCRFIEQKD